MKQRTPWVLFVSVLSLASLMSAFDGQRKGFILGGGIGGGSLSLGMAEDHVDTGVFATNFIIGYAPSASLEIYCTNNISWFKDGGEYNYLGVTGAGVTKYMKREGRGLYICGGIGVSVRTLYSNTGFGALAGIGYDVAKHWRIQGEVMFADIDRYPSWSFRATLNVIAF